MKVDTKEAMKAKRSMQTWQWLSLFALGIVLGGLSGYAGVGLGVFLLIAILILTFYKPEGKAEAKEEAKA